MTTQKNLKQLFRQKPVQLLTTPREKWMLVLFISLFIPIFLLLFQPFGVNNYDPTHRISGVFLMAACLFGAVGGFTILIYEFWLAPLLFNRTNWMVFSLRIVVGMIFLASAFFLSYNIMGGFHDWRLSSYFEFILNVIAMGIIPTFITLLFLEYRRIRKAYETFRTESGVSSARNKLIRLSADHGKEHIAILPKQLLYIEAQGNYVFIFYLEGELIKKNLLRTTMKKLERQLSQYFVLRCHRSFLVNVNRVTKVSGNAHQLQLHLSGLANHLPVSRSYIPVLEKHLDVHPV